MRHTEFWQLGNESFLKRDGIAGCYASCSQSLDAVQRFVATGVYSWSVVPLTALAAASLKFSRFRLCAAYLLALPLIRAKCTTENVPALVEQSLPGFALQKRQAREIGLMGISGTASVGMDSVFTADANWQLCEFQTAPYQEAMQENVLA